MQCDHDQSDCVIVGGSFAGLAAAMQLARARRRVLVIDAGRPRNRFTDASHGFLGQDGRPPAAIIDDARAQVLAYPTVTVLRDTVEQVAAEDGRFRLMLASGAVRRGSRLILATGIVDELPDIPGLSERWGKTVLHCPYCHGYEVADGKLGVLAVTPMNLAKTSLIAEWGKVTLFTNGKMTLSAKRQATLRARGVAIESERVEAIVGDAPKVEGIRLRGGRLVPLDAVFISPRTGMASPLAEQLGCRVDKAPYGPMVRTNEWKETSVAGVYAAGDVARAAHTASWAAADGVSAGIGVHQSLVTEF